MYGTSGPGVGRDAGQPRRQQFPGRAPRSRSGASAPSSSVTSSTRIGATAPARAAGALYDVVVTNPGDPPAVLHEGLVRGLPRRSAGEPLPRAGRDDHPRRHHLWLRRRQLLPAPRASRARKWPCSSCAPSTGRPTCRRRRPGRSSATSTVRRLRRRLDRAALRRGHHGRLPGRLAAELLPDVLGDPRPDGGLPPEGLPRHRLRAAGGDRRLLGRSDREPVRSVDRGDGAPGVTSRLRRPAVTAPTTPSPAARWPSSSRRPSTVPRPRASSSRRPGARRTRRSAGLLGVGYLPWLASQYYLPISLYPALPLVPDTRRRLRLTSRCHLPIRDNYSTYPLHTTFFKNALYQPDQLRQRVFFALHKLDVVSTNTITRPSPGRAIPEPPGAATPSETTATSSRTSRSTRRWARSSTWRRTPRPTRTRTTPARSCSSSRSEPMLLNQDGTTQNDGGHRLPAADSYDQSVIDNLKLVLTGWYIPSGLGRPSPATPTTPATT